MNVVASKPRNLGDLVVSFSRLENVTSPNEFLERLALHLQERYIQNTIRERLPLFEIPDGDLYIITPNSVFRYKKYGRELSSVGNKKETLGENEFYGIGTLERFIDYLKLLADKNKEEGRETPIRILQFYEDFREELERQIKPIGFQLVVAKNLGMCGYRVRLYGYITHITSPTI